MKVKTIILLVVVLIVAGGVVAIFIYGPMNLVVDLMQHPKRNQNRNVVQDDGRPYDSTTFLLEMDNAGKDSLDVTFGPLHWFFGPKDFVLLTEFPSGDSHLLVKTTKGKLITDTTLYLDKEHKHLINLAHTRYFIRYRDFNGENSRLDALRKTWQVGGENFSGVLREFQAADVLIESDLALSNVTVTNHLSLDEQFPDYATEGTVYEKFCREEELKNIALYGEVAGSEWLTLYLACYNQLVSVNNSYYQNQKVGEADLSGGLTSMFYKSLSNLINNDGLRGFAESKTPNTFLYALEKESYKVLPNVPEEEMRKAGRLWIQLKRTPLPGAAVASGKYLLHYRTISSVTRRRLKDPWTFYLSREGEVKNGKKQGLFVSYYANGHKESESPYEAGYLEGARLSYDKNGVCTVTMYQHGLLAEPPPEDLKFW